MGEIKSTLDLVMEKTRHLKLSDEERAAQKKKDALTSLKGLIQKYKDHKLRIDQFVAALDGWRHAFDQSDTLVVHEAVEQIEMDRDDQPILALLLDVFQVDVAPLKAVLSDYRRALQQAFEVKSDQLVNQLASRHGISGTAVVPDIENDRDWQATRQSLQSTYREQLYDRAAKMI